MNRKPLWSWIGAIAPALGWLLLRAAAQKAPPAAEVVLTAAMLVGAAWEVYRERGAAAFRPVPRDLILWLLAGLGGGALNRLLSSALPSPGIGDSPLFLLCVLAPAAEEFLYRGVIYQRLTRLMPEGGACLVNALLFAAAHGTPLRMAFALPAGLLFCLSRKKTGTVTVPVLLHMMLNAAVALP